MSSKTPTANRGNENWKSLSTGIGPRQALATAILRLEDDLHSLGEVPAHELLNADYEAGELHQAIAALRVMKEALASGAG